MYFNYDVVLLVMQIRILRRNGCRLGLRALVGRAMDADFSRKRSVIRNAELYTSGNYIRINPFIPEFLKWILPPLILVRTIVPNRVISKKINFLKKELQTERILVR